MTLPAIDESHTAKGYTPAAQVPAVFGEPRTIQSITIHYWGATGQTHDGVVDFFCNGPGQTSAHFVASDGRVSCIVSPPDAAWHAGNAHGNATSIGIECHPEATDGDYQTVADLVAWLRSQYGDLPLFPHNHWTSTSCPGPWDLTRIDALARGTAPQEDGMSFGPTDPVFHSKDGVPVSLEAILDAIDADTQDAYALLKRLVEMFHAFDVDVRGELANDKDRLTSILAASTDPKAIAAAIPEALVAAVKAALEQRTTPVKP